MWSKKSQTENLLLNTKTISEIWFYSHLA